jgi:membrane protease YdiL (CAAX protease family)
MLQTNQHPNNLKPLPLLPSLLYFGLPALLFVDGFWGGMPWLIRRGMLPYYAYVWGLGVPLALLLLLSLLWLRLEGREITWAALQSRLRLHPMERQAWLWSAGAVLVGSVVGFGLISQLSGFLIARGLIPIPATIPAFMSPTSMTDPMVAYNEAVGGLRGNWTPFIAMSIVFVFNILGEELWWRGIVLPRQELAFGQWTWGVHGVLWAVFHIFKWWDVLNLLPICLALSYVCSRQKNTTPGIIIHGVTNGVALVPLLLGILGLIG